MLTEEQRASYSPAFLARVEAKAAARAAERREVEKQAGYEQRQQRLEMLAEEARKAKAEILAAKEGERGHLGRGNCLAA